MDNALVSEFDYQEKHFNRNKIILLIEGFFVSFSFSIFSHTTVLPVYVSNITDNKFWISILIVSFFGLSNASSIFSSIIGVNSRSPKWSAIIICGLQRIGQFLIYLSTFFITGDENLTLFIFFSSYSLYSMTAGMSSPVFSNMVSSVIHRNVSSFYGSYMVSGSLAGVLSSQLIRFAEKNYSFPVNYRLLFLFGVIMAVIATFVLVFGIKEFPRPEVTNKLKLSSFPKAISSVFKNNKDFTRTQIIRLFMAVAEMAVPFYIIKVGLISGIFEDYIGIMTFILLVSNLVFSKVLGYLGDKGGPYLVVQLGSIAGLIASLLAITINQKHLAIILFILVSLSTLASNLGNSISIIVHAEKGLVPIYAAASGLLIAPFYALSSYIGGIVAENLDYTYLFYASAIFYLFGIILSRFLKHE